MKKQIFVRLGVSDIILTQEEDEKLESKFIDIPGVGSTELYLVGYEDEDGNECDENGNPL